MGRITKVDAAVLCSPPSPAPILNTAPSSNVPPDSVRRSRDTLTSTSANAGFVRAALSNSPGFDVAAPAPLSNRPVPSASPPNINHVAMRAISSLAPSPSPTHASDGVKPHYDSVVAHRVARVIASSHPSHSPLALPAPVTIQTASVTARNPHPFIHPSRVHFAEPSCPPPVTSSPSIVPAASSNEKQSFIHPPRRAFLAEPSHSPPVTSSPAIFPATSSSEKQPFIHPSRSALRAEPRHSPPITSSPAIIPSASSIAKQPFIHPSRRVQGGAAESSSFDPNHSSSAPATPPPANAQTAASSEKQPFIHPSRSAHFATNAATSAFASRPMHRAQLRPAPYHLRAQREQRTLSRQSTLGRPEQRRGAGLMHTRRPITVVSPVDLVTSGPTSQSSKTPITPAALADYGIAAAAILATAPKSESLFQPSRSSAPSDAWHPPMALPPRPPANPAVEFLNFSPAQIALFEATLSPSDLALFRAGSRMSKPRRDAILANMPSDVREERALRFPDEPSLCPPPSSERDAAEAEAAQRSAEFRPPFAVQATLMVLWYHADPLWLELLVSSMSFGVNLGFNGDSGPAGASDPSVKPVNMFDPSDPEQFELLRQAMLKDIKRGNCTAFTSNPLFEWYRLIPAGVVPKKDEAIWRFVKDYNERHSPLSVNAQTAKIRPEWCSWEKVIRRFRASVGGLASAWDISNAYPWLLIRPQDRHMTVSYIPGLGWSHRLRGDMGNARIGYLWEILGGKNFSTVMYVLSFYTTIDFQGVPVISPELFAPPPHLRAAATDLHPNLSPSAGGYANVDREIMLTDASLKFFQSDPQQALLTREDGVDLTDVSRWCDDFLSFCLCHNRSRRNDIAVVFWCQLLGFSLAKDKFFPSRIEQEFSGYMWRLVNGTLSFSEEKFAKLDATLDRYPAGVRRSHRDWEKLSGLLQFFERGYPQMAFFLLAIRRQQAQSAFVMSKQSRVSRDTATLCPVQEVLLDIDTWRACVKSMPRTVIPWLLTPVEIANMATVVGHTDWSGSPDPGCLAAVLLSHGLYASCPMPAQYYEPANPESSVRASPVGEAAAACALLYSAPAVISCRNTCIVLFTDNETFFRRYYRAKAKHDSPALDQRLRDIAVLLSTLNSRLVLLWVPGELCFADHLTRQQGGLGEAADACVRKLRAALLVRGLSRPFSQMTLSLPTTPPSLLRPPRSL